MPNKGLCPLYLPKNQRAVAYQYQLKSTDSQSTAQSVICIFRGKERDPLHKIQLAGTVKSMRWVKQGLFAVATEESSNILLYNYQDGTLEKTLAIPMSAPASLTRFSTLTTSSSYLVSSTREKTQEDDSSTPSNSETVTHLHIYDTEKFSYKRIKINGVVIHQTALAMSNHLLFCEVSADEALHSSEIHAYNLQTGTLLREIRTAQVLCDDQQPFLALLNNEYLFSAHPSLGSISTDCFLYQLSSEPVEEKTFKIEHNYFSSFYALPQGGIAVHRPLPLTHNNSSPLCIYHPLESKTPNRVISSSEVPELKTSEDPISLLAEEELPRLLTATRETATILCKLSLFPAPLAKLVTGYSLSSEAQEDRFVDEIVEGSWPKP